MIDSFKVIPRSEEGSRKKEREKERESEREGESERKRELKHGCARGKVRVLCIQVYSITTSISK